MNEDETKRIYPEATAAPLEQDIAAVTAEHQEHLLGKPSGPPTYDQAIGTEPVNTSQPSGAPPHVVVVTQPVSNYGPEPIDIQCPYCHNFCRTRLRSKPTSQTHLFALILCLLQLYCCVCLPYCMSSCMNTNHYCGMCDQYLGTYQR